MDNINTKTIGNTVYHAAVLSVLTVGIGIGEKKIVGKGIGDLTNPSLMTVGKLVGATTAAIGIKQYLETQGLPETVIKR